MYRMNRKRIKLVILLLTVVVIINSFGVFTHFYEKDFYTDFHYPYDGDIEPMVQQLKNNITPDVQPINVYKFDYWKKCTSKCGAAASLKLVYLVKSAPHNFDRRIAIRSSWGYEHRFSDVDIRTVFLIGNVNSLVMETINKEAQKFGDIVQANFVDSYFNNTFKTMMGFNWAVNYCRNSKFYMFVDDDYYISTKNVLRFIGNPVNYPQFLKDSLSSGAKNLLRRRKLVQYDVHLGDTARLYAGYVFKSAPQRHLISKWYVSLKDYPYHMWPPYVTAGAYILSREALHDMYYTSFYTKHFKFDDIYVGLLAYKVKIEPFHCDEFNFYKLPNYPRGYNYTIASHGYGDPNELLKVWTEQRSLGNA